MDLIQRDTLVRSSNKSNHVVIVRRKFNQQFLEIYSDRAKKILAEEIAYHLSLPCDAFYTYQWKQLTNLCILNRIYVNTILGTKCVNPSHFINLSLLVAKSFSKWVRRHKSKVGKKGIKTERKRVVIIPITKRTKLPENMTVDSLEDAMKNLYIGSHKDRKREREMMKI